MGCNCGSKGANAKMYEVIAADGSRLFPRTEGGTPLKATADAIALRTPGATVRELSKGGA